MLLKCQHHLQNDFSVRISDFSEKKILWLSFESDKRPIIIKNSHLNLLGEKKSIWNLPGVEVKTQ